MRTVSKTDIIIKSEICSIDRKADLDMYHTNNWDRYSIHYDESNKEHDASYIDYFFDAKDIITLFNKVIINLNFDRCYMVNLNNTKYKLKHPTNDVERDIYDEFKKMLNSLGLRVNTSSAIEMTKNEFINWSDRFSIGGFINMSEYVLLIPSLDLIIVPYHHMNYLFYCNNEEVKENIKQVCEESAFVNVV